MNIDELHAKLDIERYLRGSEPELEGLESKPFKKAPPETGKRDFSIGEYSAIRIYWTSLTDNYVAKGMLRVIYLIFSRHTLDGFGNDYNLSKSRIRKMQESIKCILEEQQKEYRERGLEGGLDKPLIYKLSAAHGKGAWRFNSINIKAK